MDMGPIKNLKGVQRVTGCLVALSRFIAWLGERSLPLYKMMKKSDHFRWTPEAQEALDSLKNLLKSPPDTDCSKRGRTNVAVHLGNDPSRQCSFGGRARGAWEASKGAAAGVLRQRSTFRLQDMLLTDVKARVRDLDVKAQAPSLL
jgi:hypothetical protein